MKIITLTICIIGLIACSSNGEESNNDSIVNSWQLIEDCFSIGSADLQCNEPDETSIIQFNGDNTFLSIHGSETCTGNYSFESANNQLEFISESPDCVIRSGRATVNLNGKKLELSWFGCTEPCVSRYELTD